ncbi:signal peptidase I [Enterococcus plantarum]|uniref:signal peptidase I n=1 Tax=Enterococcus plantarum TaxID=1077675 RepID=UPI000AF2D372|nr:signal peptidase I [Enterococcus plantarum]
MKQRPIPKRKNTTKVSRNTHIPSSGKRLSPSRDKRVSKKKRRRRGWQIKEFFLAVTLVSVIAIGVSVFFISILTVRGYSMVPTLREGDKVLIQKKTTFRRFDLVAYTVGDGDPQIRRIIGLPGETIRYTQDTLFVNEQPVDEKFLVDEINESQKNGRDYTEDLEQQPIVIPEGYYFVLGDNRPYATDSRHYGLVAEKRFLGKVTTQLFPFNEIKAF